MPLFLILVLEVLLFGYFSDQFGFLKTLGAYWIPTFLLIGLIPYLLSALQGFSRQPMDTTSTNLNRQLNRILMVVGIFALMIPFLTTRVIGLLLILPGFRHLLIWKFKSTVQKKTNQYFAKFGNGFQFYYQRGPRPFDPQSESQDFNPPMKDVTPPKIQGPQ